MGQEIKAERAAGTGVAAFRVGERVHVDDQEGEFIVIDVDPAHGCIQLLSLKPSPRLLTDVPAGSIRTKGGPRDVTLIRSEES